MYLQEHLNILMDRMLQAYIKLEFDEFERLKKQINSLKSIMNSYDINSTNLNI